MISEERKKELAGLQDSLNHVFNDMNLLNKALTHKSYVNESSLDLKHNERFEFLGDSVLDLVVSDLAGALQRVMSLGGAVGEWQGFVWDTCTDPEGNVSDIMQAQHG